MASFIRTTFTGRDNTSGDLGRILWAFMVTALIVNETVAIAHGQAFEPIPFATAAGGLMAACAAALGLKAHTEPGV